MRLMKRMKVTGMTEDGTASGEPLACQSHHFSEHVSSDGKEGDLLI